MATTTQNLGLIEPAGTDHALVANINTNSEKIDAEAGKARANFALVQNGDTATQAISQGQLVNWKGALKKATANIASGATLSSSNLTDDSVAAEIASLNDKLEKYSTYGYAEFSDTVTINQYSERVITNINIGKTGYIPIGIAGFDTGSDSFIPEQVFINPSTNYAYVKIKNYDSTAHTGTYSFRVMYVKAYSLNKFTT